MHIQRSIFTGKTTRVLERHCFNPYYKIFLFFNEMIHIIPCNLLCCIWTLMTSWKQLKGCLKGVVRHTWRLQKGDLYCQATGTYKHWRGDTNGKPYTFWHFQCYVLSRFSKKVSGTIYCCMQEKFCKRCNPVRYGDYYLWISLGDIIMSFSMKQFVVINVDHGYGFRKIVKIVMYGICKLHPGGIRLLW